MARWRLALWIALPLATGTAAPAAAQRLVRLAPRGAEIGATFDGTWHGLGGGGASRGLDFREWMQVPLAGALFDPRIAAYRLVLRPTLRQRSATGFGETLNGRQLGLAFNANVLSARPLHFTLGLTRAAGSTGGGFGTRSEFLNTQLNANAVYRNTFFPMRLSYTRRYSRDQWQNSAAVEPVDRSFAHRLVRFSGQSTKANLIVERTLYDDHVADTDLNSWNATFVHTMRWGKGSRLQSSAEYNRQAGSFATTRRAWSERAHLQHTRWISSDYAYRSVSTEVAGAASRTRGVTVGINGRIPPAVSVGLQGATYSAGFTDGTERVYTVRPRVGVDVGLPRDGHLTATGSAGFERRSRGADFLAAVLDERHQIDETRRFTLDEAEIEPVTVTIRTGDRSFIYEEGIDYELVAVGNQLRVDVPPGSRIPIGSLVLVSYRHRLPGGFADDAVTAEYDLSAQFRRVSLRHRRSLRSARGASARDFGRGVADFDETETQLTVRQPVPLGYLDADAAVRDRFSAGQQSREYFLSAGVTVKPARRLQTALGMAWNASRTAGVRVSTVSGYANAMWTPLRSLRLRARLDAFNWTQNDGSSEQFLGGSVELDWRLGFMDNVLRYEHYRRTMNAARTTHRLSLRTLRRF